MIQKYMEIPHTRRKHCSALFYCSSRCFAEDELSEGWIFVVVFQSRKHAFNLAIVSTVNAMRYEPRCRQTQIKKNDTKAFTS